MTSPEVVHYKYQIAIAITTDSCIFSQKKIHAWKQQSFLLQSYFLTHTNAEACD